MFIVFCHNISSCSIFMITVRYDNLNRINFQLTVEIQVISWILTIWLGGSFLIFVLTRVLGAEVGPLTSNNKLPNQISSYLHVFFFSCDFNKSQIPEIPPTSCTKQ